MVIPDYTILERQIGYIKGVLIATSNDLES